MIYDYFPFLAKADTKARSKTYISVENKNKRHIALHMKHFYFPFNRN